MLKILDIKDINNNIFNLYIVKDRIFLTRPNQYLEEDFKSIYFDHNTFVSYGWIDSHVHCNKTNTLYRSEIDAIGYKMGVTTVVDAGSVGANGISRMWKYNQDSVTNLKILLNISKKGIFKQSELANLNNINLDYNKKYDEFILGFKARMSRSVTVDAGTKPLEIFNNLRKVKNINKPLMVHIGNEPPKFAEVISYLQKGDLVTHTYNFKNNSMFTSEFEITSDLKLAISKGILFDVGHGNESFVYKCAKQSYTKYNFLANIISTDIYDTNIKNNKVKSLAVTMNKFRSIGVPWSEIIKRVTDMPYKYFNIKEQGQIQDNYIANLTFFKIENNSIIELDSLDNEISIKEEIVPIGVIVNGNYYEVKINGK